MGIKYSAMVAGFASKASAAASDILTLLDSAASNTPKKLTFDQLKAALGFRERLTASRTYYVRTDGNDANTGLSNTAGGAFRTVQKGVDVASTLDLNGFVATVQVADGSYPETVTAKTGSGDGSIAIKGNMTTPAAVGLTSFSATNVTTRYSLEGVSLSVGSSVQRLLADGSRLSYGTLTFGAATYAHVNALSGGKAECVGPVTVSGNAALHLYAATGGEVVMRGRTVTLVSTPSFSTAFALAEIAGRMMVDANTFSGAAAGSRYIASLNGVIFVNGAGESYLPGTTAGSKTNGGQYA